MNCRTLRIDLVKRTGRYDLVKDVGGDPWTDDGANEVLNTAQGLLDRTVEHEAERAAHVSLLPKQHMQVRFKNCRVIDNVAVSDNDTGIRVPLQQISMAEMRNLFPVDFSEVPSGTPRFYAPSAMRLAPELKDKTEGMFAGMRDWSDLAFGDDHTVFRGIVIMPPTDRALTVRIEGKFTSAPLTQDEDLSWWSVRYPAVLVSAASLILEGFLRNSQGYNDMLTMLRSLTSGISEDAIEQEMESIDFLEWPST